MHLQSNELRIGNLVTINNEKFWSELKDIPMVVYGIKEDADSKGNCSVQLKSLDGENLYSQFINSLSPIPLSSDLFLKAGFEFRNMETLYMGQESDGYFIHIGPAIIRKLFLTKFMGNEYSAFITESYGYGGAQLLNTYSYLHQIQNLIHSLGRELEIKL